MVRLRGIPIIIPTPEPDLGNASVGNSRMIVDKTELPYRWHWYGSFIFPEKGAKMPR